MTGAKPCLLSRFLWYFVLLAATLWGVAFAWFYQQIPTQGNLTDQRVRTDAIVALTGGMGRLEFARDLLMQGKAKMLLISGVDREVKPNELVAVYGIDLQNLVKMNGGTRIELDYGARDTVGNARETAQWMKEKGFTSLRLVTSSYHMPRSLLEFRHAMPEIIILPTPVFPEWNAMDKVLLVPRGSLRLILIEFHKYILRRVYYALPGQLHRQVPPVSNAHPVTSIPVPEKELKP